MPDGSTVQMSDKLLQGQLASGAIQPDWPAKADTSSAWTNVRCLLLSLALDVPPASPKNATQVIRPSDGAPHPVFRVRPRSALRSAFNLSSALPAIAGCYLLVAVFAPELFVGDPPRYYSPDAYGDIQRMRYITAQLDLASTAKGLFYLTLLATSVLAFLADRAERKQCQQAPNAAYDPTTPATAMAGWVLALLSLPMGILTALPAVAMGHYALIILSQHSNKPPGKLRAILALVFGYIAIALFALRVILD